MTVVDKGGVDMTVQLLGGPDIDRREAITAVDALLVVTFRATVVKESSATNVW